MRSLRQLGVRYLICIGGDDTTYGATRIAELTHGRIGVATVPKTIDNDLPLPENAPTFCFETARAVGTNIVESLMEDARTTARWYLFVSMGPQRSGFAGVRDVQGRRRDPGRDPPKNFSDDVFDLGLVVDTIVGSIVKRRAWGQDHGVAVVAEGIAERLTEAEIEHFDGVTRDAYGHVRLADVPLGAVLRDAVRNRLEEIGLDLTVVTKDIGYELRCAKPVPFDVDYTRTLGYGAVRYLLTGGSGALIAPHRRPRHPGDARRPARSSRPAASACAWST